jgi:hypothetical protein
MTDVVELVGVLRSRGVVLRPDGDLLRFRPAALVTSEEKVLLRQHKPAVLELLRQAPPDPEISRVLGLPVTQLDRLLQVRVPWLPESLWFVPDEAAVEALVGDGVSRGRIWTAGELLDLLSLPTTKIEARTIAHAKVEFDGEVTAVREGCKHLEEPST